MDTASPETQPGAGHVTVRYWAAVRAASGVETDLIAVDGPVTLAVLQARIRDLHRDSDRFADVLSTCSTLIGDRPVAGYDPEEVEVPPGATVELLPPFAGG